MEMLTDFQILSLVFGLAIVHVNWMVGYQTLARDQHIIIGEAATNAHPIEEWIIWHMRDVPSSKT